jgi:peroxiredoxin
MRIRRSGAGRLPAILAVLSTAATLVLTGCGAQRSAGRSNFSVGQEGFDLAALGSRDPAPSIGGKTVDGGTVNLADFHGKVVVINIWGSWCPPCRAEVSGFETAYTKYRARGVRFMGINTRDSSMSQGKQFEKHFHVTYPSVFDPYGKQILRFPKGTLNPQFIPSTVVIDRHGDVAARALVPLGTDALEHLLDKVLAEKG